MYKRIFSKARIFLTCHNTQAILNLYGLFEIANKGKSAFNKEKPAVIGNAGNNQIQKENRVEEESNRSINFQKI